MCCDYTLYITFYKQGKEIKKDCSLSDIRILLFYRIIIYLAYWKSKVVVVIVW